MTNAMLLESTHETRINARKLADRRAWLVTRGAALPVVQAVDEDFYPQFIADRAKSAFNDIHSYIRSHKITANVDDLICEVIVYLVAINGLASAELSVELGNEIRNEDGENVLITNERWIGYRNSMIPAAGELRKLIQDDCLLDEAWRKTDWNLALGHAN